jgi:NADPH2:quinone reductase
MKAILLEKHGGPSVLRFSRRPEPAPGPGEVRVRIETVGLNFAEVLSRKGLYRWAPELPYVPGMEAYGVIDAAGEGVGRRGVGEKVLVGAQFGCYAEAAVVPEAQALPAVDFYSSEENAAFLVNYMTAWVALFEMARLRAADSVLIHAAAGGVGSAAVQLAKRFGCTVFGTAGSDEKIDLLKKLAVDHAVNYRRQDFEAEIRAKTDGRGVDVVLELVGGEVYRKSLNLLAPFGRIVVAGFAGLHLTRWNPVSWWQAWRALPKARLLDMGVRSYGVLSTHLGYLLSDMAVLRQSWESLRSFVEVNQIRPVIGATFRFDEMARAHDLMESRRSFGKIVLHV